MKKTELDMLNKTLKRTVRFCQKGTPYETIIEQIEGVFKYFKDEYASDFTKHTHLFDMAECADRWEALMSSERIRYLGSGKLGDEFGQVLCVEFHSTHDYKECEQAKKALIKYTDAIMRKNQYLDTAEKYGL